MRRHHEVSNSHNVAAGNEGDSEETEVNEITVGNYRCFREHQTAQLAPLTLLVGDNSTGKTSFLAMIRALTDVAIEFKIPDFKEEPFDLGSFEEIAHHRGGRFGHAATFEGGYGVLLRKHFDNPTVSCPTISKWNLAGKDQHPFQ